MKTDQGVFRDLWGWLATHPESNKWDWPGFQDADMYYRYKEHNSCPACNTAEERRIKARVISPLCVSCPLRKSAAAAAYGGIVNVDHTTCLSGLYDMYMAGTLREREKFAAIIRDLEWEE